MNDRERATVLAFLAKVRDEHDADVTQARMIRVAPTSWRHDPAELIARVAAVESALKGPG
jgi:hypothetical protein